ncbi:Protein O-linked-mannose beta-1,4-N-acetylglucosaminyltransferase [Actinidia chinensis var. chinensis]|uniref:Protein O-linked-mannose beta-1,4-N-acetylglucosaminyltransferase n=1 Tax=Actinidia chinensis var. chinensis TaxID=1590841 RepID=A0A2R6P4V5_ACTCC|nr:Protein O-linked-mannose beta-1,4-N-acetylglucosaminyltransferase [Actinidia chinensis var. chinensis]
MICLILLSLLCTLFLGSNFDLWKQQHSNGSVNHNTKKFGQGMEDQELLNFLLRRLVRGEDRIRLEATGLACHSDLHTGVCVSNRPVRIDTRTLKIYASFNRDMPQAIRIIQPYARKGDATAMSFVSPVQILEGNFSPPACEYAHNVPAVVFSSGGFTGNLFHEFNEVIIPLFLTSRRFQSRLQFIVTDFQLGFVRKYSRILSHLSRFGTVNPALNGSVHCFPGAVVGLHYHGNLALNATGIPGGYSMRDFKKFLKESYNLKKVKLSEKERPVLILVSRPMTRTFLNEREMVKMMEELGFEVVVATPHKLSDLEKFSVLLSSCSVMVGAHGAGLTNALFLPTRAVLVQVVPLGLDWVSTNYFGGPAAEMGLNYLEYKIKPEESSLLSVYGRDHPVITSPASVFLKGYKAARAVYIDRQNMSVDIVRFRVTLVKALGLLGRSATLLEESVF